MPIYISFLRGINVGGAKTIRMAELKSAYEALGLDPAKTLLNSGNVAFAGGEKSPAKLARRLELAIEKEFGLRTTIVVRSARELAKILKGNPFPKMAGQDPSHLLVMTLAGKPRAGAKAALAKAYSGPEEIAIKGVDVYLTYPKGIGTSKLTNALLEKHLGVAGTARNWNTLSRLLKMAEDMEAA
jgi:uncharacterized protein (DUF1697 family)